MEISFVPTPDVAVILNALLDKVENRTKRNPLVGQAEGTYHASRSIKIVLDDLDLPSYFSQIDPQARIIANQQLQALEQRGLLQLKWLTGETNHILQSVALQVGSESYAVKEDAEVNKPTSKQVDNGTHSIPYAALYKLLQRTPISDQRARLESLLLSDKFRYPKEDWRARVLNHTLQQLRAGKSPSPFSLTDSNLNLDLLAVLQALPALTAETPYRVFSVRVFNDTKRFEALKGHIVSLARLGNPEWKRISAEEVLRELNLVANPNYIHLSGNWQITTGNGEILDLSSFTPSIGFPAAQISTLKSVRAESVLCIENLTTFHQCTQTENATRTRKQAVLCTYGNPSPAIRHILRLLPKTTPIFLWSDLDYGGFNILSQLRRMVGEEIQPYLMEIDTLEANIPRARPLTTSDKNNLKRLSLRPELRDVRPVMEHMLKRGVKLEQEGVEEF